MWQWQLDRSGIYFVHGVYQFLTSHQVLISDVDSKLVWHKKIPLMVYVFAARLLQNKLPTKDNHFLIAGCGEMESINHLFLHRNFFGSFGYLVRG